MHNRTPEVLYQNLRGTIRLYHGSKSGIQGPIRPASRANTDFGKGFYMSPKPDSPKALIATHKNPTLYELSVNLSGIKCVRVSGVTWALLVAYNRGKLERFKGTKFYEQIADITLNQDMVVGPIADDRMYDALTEFFNNRITDYTMLECMQQLRLGDQRVAKTNKACDPSHIQIVSATTFTPDELQAIQLRAEKARDIANRDAEECIRAFFKKKYRPGYLLDEIMEGENHDELELTPNPTL